MPEIVIEVTADDIANGRPSSNCHCPIALAVKRVLGLLTGEVHVMAHGFDVRHHWVDLPDEADQFIDAFDHGDDATPFSFTVDLPADLAGVRNA